jgi:hypothetical protein
MHGAKKQNSFLNLGPWLVWVVNATPRPLYPPVPILQEAEWALGPVWTGAENFTPTGIRSPDLPARSQSLYRLSYPGPLVTGPEWYSTIFRVISHGTKRVACLKKQVGSRPAQLTGRQPAHANSVFIGWVCEGLRLQFFHRYLFLQVILIALSNFSHVIM